MKHILVTTDFSEEAESAFAYAKELVQLIGKEKSKIILLKVIDVVIPTNVEFGYGVANAEKKGILDRLHKQASEKIKEIAQKNFAGLTIETFVLKHSKAVYQEIIEFAKTHNVDLIVMSTHGRTGAKYFLLGSVTEQVVRQSPCPVMVVPARYVERDSTNNWP